MLIKDIRTYPVWGGGRNYLFVVVETDDGLTGVGEAGLTSRELAVAGAIEHFKPLLIGRCRGEAIEAISGRELVDRVRDLGLGLRAIGIIIRHRLSPGS